MEKNRFYILIVVLFAVIFTANAQGNFDIPKVAQQSQAKPEKKTKKELAKTPQKAKTPQNERDTKASAKTNIQQMSEYELELKAGNGNIEAQYVLGKRWVLTGDSVNVAKGINWLMVSARQGHSDAQYALGSLYYKGYGVERSLQLSKQWMQRAAAKGNAKAKKFLKDNY